MDDGSEEPVTNIYTSHHFQNVNRRLNSNIGAPFHTDLPGTLLAPVPFFQKGILLCCCCVGILLFSLGLVWFNWFSCSSVVNLVPTATNLSFAFSLIFEILSSQENDDDTVIFVIILALLFYFHSRPVAMLEFFQWRIQHCTCAKCSILRRGGNVYVLRNDDLSFIRIRKFDGSGQNQPNCATEIYPKIS